MWKENKVELGRRAASLSPLSFLSFFPTCLPSRCICPFSSSSSSASFFSSSSCSSLLLLFIFFFFGFFFFSSSSYSSSGAAAVWLWPRAWPAEASALRTSQPRHPCAPPASAEANARSSWDRTVLAMRGKTVSWFLLAPLRVILMVVPTGTKRHRR